jgi:hypothetical protein
MLGPTKIPERPRYFNLTPTIVDGRCMEVKFNALCLNECDKGNRDPYALYINVDHDASDSLTVPLLVRIDPDIDNPGTRPV